MTRFIGLTGSIGMGKTTVGRLFAALGVPVHDADAAVHALYRGAAAAAIEEVFPGTTSDGAVDRVALGARVLGDREALSRLEAIVHPLARAAEEAFRAGVRAAGTGLAVCDIPLLFETGADARFEAIVVVSAPADVQRARVLSRPGMTPDRLDAILARQTPDAIKRARAHFVVDTGRDIAFAARQVRDIARALAYSGSA